MASFARASAPASRTTKPTLPAIPSLSRIAQPQLAAHPDLRLTVPSSPTPLDRAKISGLPRSARPVVQRQAEAAAAQAHCASEGKAEVGGACNHSALPGALKAGVEALSGVRMDTVRVRYRSPEPARLGALAFARGRDIHLGPGQEHHLPHEAWHVVQQAQGRVKPTLQRKGGVINDESRLEREATVMGGRATKTLPSTRATRSLPLANAPIAQLQDDKGKEKVEDEEDETGGETSEATEEEGEAEQGRGEEEMSDEFEDGGSSEEGSSGEGSSGGAETHRRSSLPLSFRQGAGSGIAQTGFNLTNAFNPKNFRHAREQGGQMLHGIMHPWRSGKAAWNSVKALPPDVDKRQTVSGAIGDWAGSLFSIWAGANAISRVATPPLAKHTRYGGLFDKAYEKTAGWPFQKLFQKPEIKNWLMRKPVMMLAGMGLGAMNFFGGLAGRNRQRASNRENYPASSKELQNAYLDAALANTLGHADHGYKPKDEEEKNK